LLPAIGILREEREGNMTKANSSKVKGRQELGVEPPRMELQVDIPHQKFNFFVFVPKDPEKWGKEMRKAMKLEELISMQIDNLATGGGACAIGFFPSRILDTTSGLEDGKGFGIVVSKEVLASIERMVDIAYENFID
jgi:hypothetical protein